MSQPQTAGTEIARIQAFCVPPRWIFVRVETRDGATGWGEAILPKRRESVLGALRDLAVNLEGANAGRIEELAQRMRRGGFFRDGPVLATATAAIEQALWDLKGRRLGVPVHELLGGPVRDHVRVYAWIGGDRPEAVVADARTRTGQGFTAVKMNATEEFDHVAGPEQVERAVARVAALRAEFGSSLDIAVDCHGRVPRAALGPLLAGLAPYDLLWVEEPLAPGLTDLLPEVARLAGPTRLATGERLTSRWDFRTLLVGGAASILQPDVSLTGLAELATIARMADAFDLPVVPHCPNGPISLAASLQVASNCLNIPIHEQSLGLHYHQGYDGLPSGEMLEYLRDPAPLTPQAGTLAVPRGPGLGIELDEDRITERAESAGDWRLPDPDWRHPDGRIAEW